MKKEEIIKFYDNFEDKLKYDRNIAHARYKYIEELAKLKLTADHSVLDLGCGIGTTSIILGKYAGEVIGVDIAPKLIECATRENFLDNVSFEIADITELMLPRQFDAVCLFDVLEHILINNALEAIQCIHRHLRADGDAHIIIPYWRYLEHKKRCCPDSIQIVDNAITLQQLNDWASLSMLEIVTWEVLSLYNKNDYVYAKLVYA